MWNDIFGASLVKLVREGVITRKGSGIAVYPEEVVQAMKNNSF
jgi:hypothetical protein